MSAGRELREWKSGERRECGSRVRQLLVLEQGRRGVDDDSVRVQLITGAVL